MNEILRPYVCSGCVHLHTVSFHVKHGLTVNNNPLLTHRAHRLCACMCRRTIKVFTGLKCQSQYADAFFLTLFSTIPFAYVRIARTNCF